MIRESAARRASTGTSTTIRERYPAVEVVEFQLEFVPRIGRPFTLARHRKPNHSALFLFDCPSGECVGGGFDLNPSVHAMLREKEHRTEGGLVCRGWTNGRWRNTVRCNHELHFVAWADYRSI